VASFNPNGSRNLGKTRLKIMIRTGPPHPIELDADPESECEVRYGSDPGALHHGMSAL
jgi:hypothetical protein